MTYTAIMSANAPDISTIDKWLLVFKTVPAHGPNIKPYMTMAMVLAPQDQGGIIRIDVAVINPVGLYSGHVLDQWDTLVRHWARDELFAPPVVCEEGFGHACDEANREIYSIGAVLLNAASILHHNTIWPEPVARKDATSVRNTVAAQALHAHRDYPPEDPGYESVFDDSNDENADISDLPVKWYVYS